MSYRVLRVWRYRDWCWSCKYGRTRYRTPCAVGQNYATPGEAGDAARRHLRDHHGVIA